MKKQKNRNNFVLKNKTDGGAFKDTMQNLRSKAIGKFDTLKNAVKNIKLTEKPLSYVAGETEINQLNEKYEVFKTIRGEGLLLGCVLKDKFAGKAKDINNLAGEEGLLSLIAGPNVVRFTPSLIIPFADIDEGLKRFERAIARFVEIQKDEQAA